MKVKHLGLALVIATGALFVAPSGAFAAGSDDPTPYTVSETGVQLPAGDTFQANGHINWRTTAGSGGMHFDPNNGHPGGAYIGQSFFPITLAPGECITWVQISHYNEHFGEGGQAPVCASSVDQCEAIPAEYETQYQYQREVTNYVTQYHFRKFTRERSQVVVSPEVWQNFSPNKDQGRFEGPPTWPTDPRGTWHHQDKSIPGGHQGPDGVYQKGHGNSSWFYRQSAVLDWSEWGAWTAWEPETHTSWENSDVPLGQPAHHASGSSNGLNWERQWQAQFDGQTRQVENGTSTETSDWVTSAPEGDGWSIVDTRQVETKPGVPAKWQNDDPSQACFNGPEKPKPLSGEETRDLEPVCVVPADGTAEVTQEGRTWTQGHTFDQASRAWVLNADKEYTDWMVVKEYTIDLDECAPLVPPTDTPKVPDSTPREPTPPVKAELAVTGASPTGAIATAGALSLLAVGSLLIARRFAHK